jgi:sarcosine oxidase, subunit gamma
MPEITPSVQLRDAGARTRIRVQAYAADAKRMASIPALGGRPLPPSIGETAQGSARALCLGPTDWLLVSREVTAADLSAQLRAAAGETEFAIVDVSDGLVSLDVSGAGSRMLLAKGCGLDLHPRSFPPGRCARTRLADLPVVVDCLAEAGHFELHVSRSYSAYLLSWLTDAAA